MMLSQLVTSFPCLFGETLDPYDKILEKHGCFGEYPRNELDCEIVEKYGDKYSRSDENKSESDLVDTDVTGSLHYLCSTVEQSYERRKTAAAYYSNDSHNERDRERRKSEIYRKYKRKNDECGEKYERE